MITHLFGFSDFESPQSVHLDLVNALDKFSEQKNGEGRSSAVACRFIIARHSIHQPQVNAIGLAHRQQVAQ